MNTLFIVSAPSGSGKTYIMKQVMGKENEIISFTTRKPRQGEVDGVDYLFITKDMFHELDNSNGLIEKTAYPPHALKEDIDYYGITKKEFDYKILKGNAYIVVDYIGMQQLKQIYPKCVTIYIYTKKEDAIENMRDRGDSEEYINKRMTTFSLEQVQRTAYDYIITNERGKVNDAISIVKAIVNARG